MNCETPNLPVTDDYKSIVLNNTVLIDVRAPVEFEHGAFLNAVNLPLMTDEERKLVGICYKQKGSDEALKLGHSLVCDSIKAARISAWCEHLKKFPNSMIYCFRGGKRSKISQQWICKELGFKITRLAGGYKAFRRFLIEESKKLSLSFKKIIVGGNTGAGKTQLIRNFNATIDLENLANHRGSSFGRYITPQPTQINFENNLAYELIKKDAAGYKTIILEDEGRHIGHRILPLEIFKNFYLHSSYLIILEVDLNKRVENTFEEYVVNEQKLYEKSVNKNECAVEKWFNAVVTSLGRIKKRLGGVKYKKALALLTDAYNLQLKTGDLSAHKKWVEFLLKEYYDPMYEYQINKRADIIKFKGSYEEIIDYINSIVCL